MSLSQAYAVAHGATQLSGLTNLDKQVNPEIDNDIGIGSLFPQFVVIRSIQPRILFNSRAAAAMLAVTGVTGADIDGGNNLVATYAQLTNGVPSAGSVHRTYTAANGLLLPRRLSCAHRADAVVDAEAILWSSDGAADPFTIADNAALPAITRDNIRHTLASVTFASIDMGCVTNVTVEFGNNASSLGCLSNIYDQHAKQSGTQAVITITGIDTEKFAAAGIPTKGKRAEHADTEIVLRKYDTDGNAFVAPATTEHIQITAAGLATVVNHSGQGLEEGQLTVQLTCDWDGTNAPLQIDTAYGY